MNWEKLKGKFIVLDGPDGSGKSTQLRLLNEVINEQGISSLTLRDPGGTAIGDQIRRILLDNANTEMSVRCEMLLYMASRAQLYEQRIAPALADGQCVLCDRWVSSTYAYQAVAGKIGPGIVLETAGIVLERLWPDLTIIIDLPGEVGLRRITEKPDRMEEKPRQFHQRVCRAFLELAKLREDFRVVDGSGTVRQVHHNICEIIHEFVTL